MLIMTVQCGHISWQAGAGSLIANAETDKLFTLAFLLARWKSAKMLGKTISP